MRNLARRRPARSAALCLLALALAAALASCGGDSSQATARAGTEASRPETDTQAPLSEGTKAKLRAATSGGRCAGQLGELLAAMDGLRGALVAGLAYEQYVGQVKKIIAAYERLPVDELALGCLRAAGGSSERALNRYIAASNEWTECVEVPSCEAASIEAALQGKWKEASGYLSKAERGLRRQSSG